MKKIKIGFLINSKEDNKEYFEKAKKVLFASPLSEYYELSNQYQDEVTKEIRENEVEKENYNFLATLYKKERFLEPVKSENSPEFFYVVPKWEVEEKARLYNMLKLMQSLNEESLYRIDIYPEEISQRIQTAFSKPLNWLRNATKFQGNEISLSDVRKNTAKDPNAEETLKQYEEFKRC